MIDPLDEGFRYGRGAFETVRVSRGRALLRAEHVDALKEAAVALGLDSSRIEPGDPPADSGFWRWILTPRQFLTLWVDEGVEEVVGVELGLSRLRVCSTAWESRHKTLSYLLQIQAREESVTGRDVLLNENGHMAGATMANLFWVRDGRVFTPSRDCGCRNGAVRRWILRNTPDLAEVAESPAVLDGADEIFLTNSRLGIVPVLRWQGMTCNTGPVTLGLRGRLLEAWNG
ncbi:MAG: aminotransferase class IV [Candidatus Methylacidiphilales bacterium]|nr:aminotransferase class IV [Candidatus Methylacidiphilales bacterium]